MISPDELAMLEATGGPGEREVVGEWTRGASPEGLAALTAALEQARDRLEGCFEHVRPLAEMTDEHLGSIAQDSWLGMQEIDTALAVQPSPAAPDAPYPTRPVADPLSVIGRLAHGMHGGDDIECEEDTIDDGFWCSACWKYASDWMAADSTWASAAEVAEALAEASR